MAVFPVNDIGVTIRSRAEKYLLPIATPSATALVHEAYLKILTAEVDFNDRGLLPRGRPHDATDPRGRRQGQNPDKRGGNVVKLQLDEAADLAGVRDRELIALDDALAALAKFDPRKAQAVELRFFGGLTVEETAEVLKISGQRLAGLAFRPMMRKLRQIE